MPTRNPSARDHLERVAAAKRAAAREDDAFWLSLPPGERLRRSLRHSQETIDSFTLGIEAGERTRAPAEDEEARAWRRVRKHIAGLRGP